MNNTITKARRLIKDRMGSLEKDVKYCILDNEGQKNWPAPFPALLYCFSTIDLMGALYWKCTLSDSKQKNNCVNNFDSGVTNKSLNYMIDFMKYPDLEANLIQKVFRHKLVHLAQPRPIAQYYEKKYAWIYVHNDRNAHLRILNETKNDINHFQISIWSLVEDVVESALGPNGYIEQLSKDTSEGLALRKSFEKAYVEVCG